MKRLLLLTTLIGVLFAVPDSFAKTSEPNVTIKYKNGCKYVGEIREAKTASGRMKLKHGKGIMYFVNGDQFNGEWFDDQCKRGTYKFADGDIFVGEISNSSMLPDGSMCFSSDCGQITFASEGTIKHRQGYKYKIWHYPANCSFTGTIKDNKKPYTGTFDCTLTTKDGDRFTGKLSNGHIGYGEIEYANGDTFEGDFKWDSPSSGKYRYENTTEIKRENHTWKIPAGCVFEGNIVQFTGTVNMEITNVAGDKFVGKLNNGAPDEGTMTLANGTTETGKWQFSMSPSEYEAHLAALEAQRREQEAQRKAQRKAQRREYDRKCLSAFESYINNHIAKKRAENIWNTCFMSIACGNSLVRDDEELINGVSIKLSQLYVDKKVTYTKTGKEIYICTAVEYTTDSTYIEMVLKPLQGGAPKTLYLTKIRISKSPEIDSNFLPLDYPYPNTLPHVYYRCEAIESPGSEGSFGDDLVSLVSDNTRNAAAQAKEYCGEAVFNRQAKLGMTVEMVQIIKKSEGRMRRHVESGRETIVLTYGGDYNIFFGNYSKRYTYTFVNNRLTEFTE